MHLTLHFFYLGVTGVTICSILVIESRNSVYAMFFLLVTFIFSALFLLGLNIEFLSLNLVILYVGAIIILFLLITMSMNQRKYTIEVKNIPIIHNVFYFLLFIILKTTHNWSLFLMENNSATIWSYKYFQDVRLEIINYINYYQDLNIFGFHLYTSNFLLFILCGFLLLITMICSLILILRVQQKYKYVFA